MTILIITILAFLLGVLLTPALLFLRARRDDSWDDSNITNMYRVIAHLATHPSDFGKMQYSDGQEPFWYINKDEITDIVESRPTSKDA